MGYRPIKKDSKGTALEPPGPLVAVARRLTRRRTFTLGLPAAIAAMQARHIVWGRRQGTDTAASSVPVPAAVRVARCDRGVSDAEQRIALSPSDPRRVRRRPPGLDTGSFATALHEQLAPRAGGYSMQLRRAGAVVADQQFQWARTPMDGSQPWTSATRMHIASISKLMTAIAVVHVCAARNIEVDRPIASALPASWTRGPGIERLTLRHLLTHQSGFHVPGSACDYTFIKNCVAAGVAEHFGQRKYHNVNFGLCRVLIPILAGRLDPQDDFGHADDVVWDLQTVHHFAAYCNAHVFAPSGVATVGFVPDARGALAYPMPVGKQPGWDSGDLATASGGAGFRMAVGEVLAVMGAFRRGALLAPRVAERALHDRFGIDQQVTTPAGDLFNKNGGWRRDGFAEQCVAVFAPGGIEIGVFVNSPLRVDETVVPPSPARGALAPPQRASLRRIVAQAYVDSLR